MTLPLIKYDAACLAVANAKAVDEAKDLRDKADGMRAYARQANNRQLEIDAAEIRMRAERRLGELMAEQRDTVGLAKGQLRRGSALNPREDKPTLAEAGIDKHLADRARKMAAMPEERFEEELGHWRESAKAQGGLVTTNILPGNAEPAQRDAKARTSALEVEPARTDQNIIYRDLLKSAIAGAETLKSRLSAVLHARPENRVQSPSADPIFPEDYPTPTDARARGLEGELKAVLARIAKLGAKIPGGRMVQSLP